MGGKVSRVAGKHESRAPKGTRLKAATAWLTFAKSVIGLVTALLLLALAMHGL